MTAAVGLVVGTVPAVAALDPVAQAREQASASTAARQGAEARLAAASARRGELEQRTSELAGADAAATEQLAEAHRQVRELAVAAFIDGGRTKILQASLEPEEAAAVSWRVGMVAGGAGQVSESVDRYEQLQAQNDPEQQAVAQELDRTRAAEDQARSDVVQTSAAERDGLVGLAPPSQVGPESFMYYDFLFPSTAPALRPRTAFRSGPTAFLPSWWQALHLLNTVLPASASAAEAAAGIAATMAAAKTHLRIFCFLSFRQTLALAGAPSLLN